MASEKSKLSKNIISLGLVQIANYVLPIASVPVISRIIGPEKYGIINFTASFVTYFTLLINYGFDLSATRRITKNINDIENRNRVFNEVFTTQLFLFVVSIIIFGASILFIPQLAAEKKVAIFTFLTCIAALFTQNWMFQAMQDLQKIALLNFFLKLLFVVIVLLVVHKREDYIWQPLVISMVSILVAIISFIWAIRLYKVDFKLVSVKACLRVLCESKIVFFSVIIVNLYTTSNIVILGLMRNQQDVGYFTAGQRLITVIQSIITLPLWQALYPFIGKSFAESKAKGLEMAQKLVPIIFITTSLAALLMIIVGPHLLILFYGKAFSPSVIVFQIMAFIPMIVTVSNIFGVHIMLNLQMDKLFFRICMIGATFSLCFNFLLIHTVGYVGTAINWVLTEMIIACSLYIALYRQGINPINFKFWNLKVIYNLTISKYKLK